MPRVYDNRANSIRHKTLNQRINYKGNIYESLGSISRDDVKTVNTASAWDRDTINGLKGRDGKAAKDEAKADILWHGEKLNNRYGSHYGISKSQRRKYDIEIEKAK